MDRDMRKKQIMLLILMVLCIFSVACAGNREDGDEQGTPINIYCLNKEETKIIIEEKYLTKQNPEDMIVETLELLTEVPEDLSCKAAVGTNLSVVSYSFEDEQVTIAMNDKYKELSATTEILTRAAIVRTLTQIPGVEYVSMTVNGEPLVDANGTAVGFMTADLFIDNEGEEINAYEKTVLRLYFANESGDKLVAINRSIIYNSNISLEKLVVEQLISGPISGDSYQTINPDTKLLGATVKDGVCYVNFDSAFLAQNQNLNVSTDVCIYSIVNSLVELSNINKVQITVDGDSSITFREKYPLTTVFERNLPMIQ